MKGRRPNRALRRTAGRNRFCLTEERRSSAVEARRFPRQCRALLRPGQADGLQQQRVIRRQFACKPWPDAELSAIDPAMIVCIGATAARAVLGPGFELMRERGRLLRLADAQSNAAPLPTTPHTARKWRLNFLYAFVRDVVRGLEETHTAPSALQLEITESAYSEDVTGAVDTLVRLRELGVRISLDDFGTGCLSLSMFCHEPRTGFDRGGGGCRDPGAGRVSQSDRL